MIGQKCTKEGGFQWGVPLQSKQHEGCSQTRVTDGWNPANGDFFSGQINQKSGQHGEQDCAFRGNRTGVQRKIEQVTRRSQWLGFEEQGTHFGHGARRAERFGRL